MMMGIQKYNREIMRRLPVYRSVAQSFHLNSQMETVPYHTVTLETYYT